MSELRSRNTSSSILWNCVQQFFLGRDGTYGKGEVLDSQEILQLKTIGGIEIMLWEVFEVERPLEEELSP